MHFWNSVAFLMIYLKTAGVATFDNFVHTARSCVGSEVAATSAAATAS